MGAALAGGEWGGGWYPTRHRGRLAGTGGNMSRSRAHRKAVSVLPLPVGAQMSVHSPAAIAGHPSVCARVAAPNDDVNHCSTAG